MFITSELSWVWSPVSSGTILAGLSCVDCAAGGVGRGNTCGGGTGALDRGEAGW